MAKILGIDLGYKGTKIWWENQFYKIASTINYYNDSGISLYHKSVYYVHFCEVEREKESD